jgi:hypothetical protein
VELPLRKAGSTNCSIFVHGVAARWVWEGRAIGASVGDIAARDAEVRERDLVAKEAERLRGVVRASRRSPWRLSASSSMTSPVPSKTPESGLKVKESLADRIVLQFTMNHVGE